MLFRSTEVLENAYMNCTSIQSIKLPKLLRLRNASFQNCVALNNLYLATETSNTIENVFQVRPFLSIDGINDYSLIDVNLYLSKSEFEGTYHWDNRPNIVGNTWKEFGPFKSINVVE